MGEILWNETTPKMVKIIFEDSTSAQKAVEAGGLVEVKGLALLVRACPKPPSEAEVRDLEKQQEALQKRIKASRNASGSQKGSSNSNLFR